MRKYLRAIARANMKLEGLQRVNKPRGRSFFSKHWREYARG